MLTEIKWMSFVLFATAGANGVFAQSNTVPAAPKPESHGTGDRGTASLKGTPMKLDGQWAYRFDPHDNAVTFTVSAQTIVIPASAPANVRLAAKEIRRYVYLRTGELLPVAESGNNGIALRIDSSLEPQQYRLKTAAGTLTISGGSGVSVLYGAYAFVGKLGVRFYLHGDVVPDGKIPFTIPQLDETYRATEATSHFGCLRAELDRAVNALKTEPDAALKKQRATDALTIRISLARGWEKLLSFQVAACDTPGELGTIANLEMHNRRMMHLLDGHDQEIAAAHGTPLPAEAMPSAHFDDAPQLNQTVIVQLHSPDPQKKPTQAASEGYFYNLPKMKHRI